MRTYISISEMADIGIVEYYKIVLKEIAFGLTVTLLILLPFIIYLAIETYKNRGRKKVKFMGKTYYKDEIDMFKK